METTSAGRSKRAFHRRVGGRCVFDSSIGLPPFQKRLNFIPSLSHYNSTATMLHTKAVARQDTANWKKVCKHSQGFCRLGTPYPPGAYEANLTEDKDGWTYNCWINEKVENYWVPKLQAALDGSEKPWLN